MGTQEQTILLVSDDAALCAAARLELERIDPSLRVAAVSTLDAARSILEGAAPVVILLEDACVTTEGDGPRGRALRLDAAVATLAGYAPVVVIGDADCQTQLAPFVAAGAADYVARSGGCLPVAVKLVERRLRESQLLAASAQERSDQYGSTSAESLMEESGAGDFGEVLRHELNNPLTGILGNAELLLTELRRKKDDRLPAGAQMRLETIAALAVRLRETVRRLSQEWEARQNHAQLR